jgi:hypothetical protein
MDFVGLNASLRVASVSRVTSVTSAASVEFVVRASLKRDGHCEEPTAIQRHRFVCSETDRGRPPNACQYAIPASREYECADPIPLSPLV